MLPRSFYRRRIIGKTRITDAATREQVLGALDRGVRLHDGVVASCFEPRHAIRVEHDGVTHFVSICFECLNVYVFVGDKGTPKHFAISREPQPVFDKVLRDAGVPLADKPH